MSDSILEIAFGTIKKVQLFFLVPSYMFVHPCEFTYRKIHVRHEISMRVRCFLKICRLSDKKLVPSHFSRKFGFKAPKNQ